jgi:hypothetical protein
LKALSNEQLKVAVFLRLFSWLILGRQQKILKGFNDNRFQNQSKT